MKKEKMKMSKLYFTKILKVPCKQLETQPKGSSCNKNNGCTFPKCEEKLFLCSRDNPNIPIGIMREREWIKENMEFEEEELAYLIGGMSVRKPFSKLKDENSEWTSDPLAVTIFAKCPCCDSL